MVKNIIKDETIRIVIYCYSAAIPRIQCGVGIVLGEPRKNSLCHFYLALCLYILAYSFTVGLQITIG